VRGLPDRNLTSLPSAHAEAGALSRRDGASCGACAGRRGGEQSACATLGRRAPYVIRGRGATRARRSDSAREVAASQRVRVEGGVGSLQAEALGDDESRQWGTTEEDTRSRVGAASASSANASSDARAGNASAAGNAAKSDDPTTLVTLSQLRSENGRVAKDPQQSAKNVIKHTHRRHSNSTHTHRQPPPRGARGSVWADMRQQLTRVRVSFSGARHTAGSQLSSAGAVHTGHTTAGGSRSIECRYERSRVLCAVPPFADAPCAATAQAYALLGVRLRGRPHAVDESAASGSAVPKWTIGVAPREAADAEPVATTGAALIARRGRLAWTAVVGMRWPAEATRAGACAGLRAACSVCDDVGRMAAAAASPLPALLRR
jgi:hypothetical protein